MKKIFLLCMIMFSTSILFAQQATSTTPPTTVRTEVIEGTAPPNESEQKMMDLVKEKNPILVHAISELEAVYAQLSKQSDESYGGNKGRALIDTHAAIVDLRKALYYRVSVDEQAQNKTH
jgi:hypothetical protein